MADAAQPQTSSILHHFQQKLQQIDDLEQKLDDKSNEIRCRLMNLLPSLRRSHARLFVTHSYEPPTQLVPAKWILQIEGKPLLGDIDFKAAKEFDDKTNYTNPPEDSVRMIDKEEQDLKPARFTHFFDQAAIEFKTIYKPKPHPMKQVSPTKKSSRRSSGTKATPVLDDDDPRNLTASAPTLLRWQRQYTADADAFQVQYNPVAPPEHRLEIHSVVAKVALLPREAEPLYQVTSALQQFFPYHVFDPNQKKTDIPLENEIHIPQCLTMGEIIRAFFIYARDRKLNQESMINCDKKLQQVFQVEQFAFSDLQQMLLSRELLVRMNQAPIRLSYVMKEETALVPPEPVEDHIPSMLQLDTDVVVPNFGAYRIRELMRRCKRRELDYTTARTKARYSLVTRRARDEELVKRMVDRAVNEHSIDMIPVHEAVSKSSLPGSEVRLTAEADMRISYLLSRLEEQKAAAEDAWKTYHSLLGMNS